ncbi:MAG: outer membrane protein assembly factor BamD [Anaerolineaceae bacterium]|nr:outer membrane protein assembly factor BamD [Anaerolineaceae bacterium]
MRWLIILATVATLLTLVATAEAKLVFRGDKWVLVPDDEDASLAPTPKKVEPGQSPTNPPRVEAPPREQPPARPAPEVQPPVRQPVAERPQVKLPPTEKQVEQPVEQPVEKPLVEPPARPQPPSDGQTEFKFRDGRWVPAIKTRTPQPVRKPVARRRLTQEPVTEKPPTREAVVEAPPGEKPSLEEPVVKKPALAMPTAEQPPVAQPTETPPVQKPVIRETRVTEKPAAQPPSDGETGFEFRDGRWVPVIKATEAEPAGKTVTPDVAELPKRKIPETPGIIDQPRDRRPAELSPVVAVVPLPDPMLTVSRAPSVGEKYRNPAPSQAADEAEQIVDAAGQGSPEELATVRSMIERFRGNRFAKTARAAARFLKRHKNSAYAEAVAWLRAEAVFAGGDYYKAFRAYEDFIDNYAGSRMVDKALVREMETAEALLGPARRKVLGLGLGSGNDEAVAILEKVYAHRPTGPLAADAIFRIGEFNTAKGKFEEAEEMYRRFLDEFPNHPRSRQAQLLAAQSAMASSLGPTYDDASMNRAQDLLRSYQDKYPQMAARENVAGALEKIRRNRARKKYEMAAYYWRARRPKAATFYARKVLGEFPGTPAAAEARQLLEKIAAR